MAIENAIFFFDSKSKTAPLRNLSVHAEKETNMLLWGTIVRLYKRWRAYERTYEELMRLDDRELADINIRRTDIDSIARHTARGI
jgi:uncharacterized protein YjiS (DUF1127 family)